MRACVCIFLAIFGPVQSVHYVTYDYTKRIDDADPYPLLLKDVQCAPLLRQVLDTPPVLAKPPSSIPPRLRSQYTMGGRIEVVDWYINDKTPDRWMTPPPMA